MGLFDRFKKDAGAPPDALTREALARVRALPAVEDAEPVDADTLSVAWRDLDEPVPLSLSGLRGRWTKASGFNRIELMDDFVSLLAPPTPAPAQGDPAPAQGDPAPAPDDPAPAPDDPPPQDPLAPTAAPPATEPVAHDGPAPEPAPSGPPADVVAPDGPPALDQVRDRLRLVVRRAGVPDVACTWPVAGALEAVVVVGDPGAPPVGRAELLAWQVEAEDVLRPALDALVAHGPALDPIGAGVPAWVPTRPADHLAAWLAAPELLLEAAGLVEGIVLCPLPTELVVVDPTATDLLGTILTGTLEVAEARTDLLWPAPLWAGPEGLGPWSPPDDHPHAELVGRLRSFAAR